MSELIGLGLDLCGIERMRALLEKRGVPERLFTEAERSYILGRGACAAESMAGIFAAKEALCKALGTGIAFPLTDIVVLHTAAGAPYYQLTGEAARLAGDLTPMLSISHEGDTAAAVCLLQRVTTTT